MSKKRSEQRASKRIPVEFKVDWSSEGHFLYENASNISEHGIFVETSQPLKEGTEIELQFTLPHSNKRIKVLGEVAWVNHLKSDGPNLNPGMGVRFKNLSDIDRETILSLIKKLAVL